MTKTLEKLFKKQKFKKNQKGNKLYWTKILNVTYKEISLLLKNEI